MLPVHDSKCAQISTRTSSYLLSRLAFSCKWRSRFSEAIDLIIFPTFARLNQDPPSCLDHATASDGRRQLMDQKCVSASPRFSTVSSTTLDQLSPFVRCARTVLSCPPTCSVGTPCSPHLCAIMLCLISVWFSRAQSNVPSSCLRPLVEPGLIVLDVTRFANTLDVHLVPPALDQPTHRAIGPFAQSGCCCNVIFSFLNAGLRTDRVHQRREHYLRRMWCSSLHAFLLAVFEYVLSTAQNTLSAGNLCAFWSASSSTPCWC